mmetsp:Transcript_19786/g.40043  ORF Transcript_19786/g.40043 Transcript_19786/m.40043 type:complete len:288 (+) Transcript_19786:1008-1871(+)
MRARPAFCITDRTSAKSTLMSPGLVMISDMPTIPCRRMLSARMNASCSGRSDGDTSRRRSLETTMRMSTCFLSSSIAATACCMRICPSNENGFVTIPTVRLPARLATSAMTGVAPEPVPPPIPAVTKTMSVLLRADSIAFTLSTAAERPIAGLAPAPSPLVVPGPIWIRLGAFDLHKACTSVLTAQNSTLASPSSMDSIIRFTVFPPPPPTPTTLMLHGALAVSEGTATWLKTRFRALRIRFAWVSGVSREFVSILPVFSGLECRDKGLAMKGATVRTLPFDAIVRG